MTECTPGRPWEPYCHKNRCRSVLYDLASWLPDTLLCTYFRYGQCSGSIRLQYCTHKLTLGRCFWLYTGQPVFLPAYHNPQPCSP